MLFLHVANAVNLLDGVLVGLHGTVILSLSLFTWMNYAGQTHYGARMA